MDITAPVSAEEAAAVEKFVQEFKGEPKICTAIVGAKGIGISDIMIRLHGNRFLEHHPETIADDELRMWRTIVGKEVWYEGMLLRPGYSVDDYPQGYISPYMELRHVEVCIFAYDVTSRTSFDGMKRYYSDFLLERSREGRWCRVQCRPICKPRKQPFKGLLYVIANKIDKPQDEWTVALAEGQEYAASIDATFIAISAKTGEGCRKDLLSNMAKHAFLRRTHVLTEGYDNDVESQRTAFLNAKIHRNLRFWY